MHNYKEIKMLLLTNLNKSIDKRMGGVYSSQKGI